MAGVAENLNVCITLTLEKPATKVVRRRNRFSIERLSNDYCVTLKRLFHSAVGAYFDRYCRRKMQQTTQNSSLYRLSGFYPVGRLPQTPHVACSSDLKYLICTSHNVLSILLCLW